MTTKKSKRSRLLTKLTAGLLAFLFILQPFHTLAFEIGHAPAAGAVMTTDSKTSLPLDKAMESGQAGAVASAGAAGKETTPGAKPSIPQAQTSSNGETVTLPKISGLTTLGSKSDVDESSGAFLYTLPIRVPSGHADLAPSLSVNYDSRRNNQTSYIGLGWDIQLPKIERMNKNGADVMYDETNFTSSEYGELALTAPAEKQFGQYTVKYGFGEFLYRENNTWEITDKDGVTSVYGATIRDRVDTGDPDKTQLWVLSKQTDQLGNTIDYLYIKSEGKLYPQSIVYNDGMARVDFTYQVFNFNTATTDGDMVDYGSGVRVKADRRLTDITVTAAGERRLDYKFNSGDYLTGVSGEFGDINFTYRTSIVAPFSDASTLTTFTPPNQRTIWQYTWEDYYKTRTPQMPLYHNYPIGDPYRWIDIDNDGKLELVYSFVDFQNIADKPTTDWPYKNPNTYQNKRVVEVYRIDSAGQGGMTEDLNLRIDDLSANFENTSPDLIMYDMQTSQVDGKNILVGYFRNKTTGATSASNFIYDSIKKKYTLISGALPPPAALPSDATTPTIPDATQKEISALKQPLTSWVDLDYDDDLDLVVNHLEGMRVYRNDGTVSNVTTFVYMPNYDLVGIKLTDTATPTFTLWRDMNGDGLDDFYRSGKWFLNRRTYFQYSEGYTLSGQASESPITTSAVLSDINGDGLLDIPSAQRINTGSGFEFVSQKSINNMGSKTALYQAQATDAATTTTAQANSVTTFGCNQNYSYYYLTCDQGKLSNSSSIPSLPWSSMQKTPVNMNCGVACNYALNGYYINNNADFNGDGVLDYLYMYGATQYLIYGGKNTTPPDFSLRDYVGKMTGITNNTLSGPQRTIIIYKKADLTNERLDGKPATVWVVDTLDNGLSTSDEAVKYSYGYMGGRIYKDPTELSKRTPGFASVTETDSLGFATTSYFHQANGDDALSFEVGDTTPAKLGRMYRSEVKNKAGELMNVKRTKWSTYDISPQKQYLFDELDEQYDLIKKVATAIGYTVDVTIGEVTRTSDYGAIEPASWNTLDGKWNDTLDDALVLETQYTATLPMVRPAKSIVRDAKNNQVLREMTYAWDGGVLSAGLLTKSTDRVDSETVRTSLMEYSPKGTLIKSTNAAGDATIYVLDSSQVAPISVTNPLGQTTNLVMDYLTGQPKKTTTPDGVVSEYTYHPIYDFETSYAKNGIKMRNASATMDYSGRRISQNESTAITYKFPDSSRYQKSGNSDIYTISSLDAQGNIGTVNSNATGTTSVTFNARGDEASVMPSGSSQAIRKTYDAYGRLATVASPLGVSNYSYDGLAVTENRPNGGTKTLTANLRGALLSATDNYGTASYVYDKLGNLTSLTDADGNRRDFIYDMAGQMKQMTDYHRPGDSTYGVYNFEYDILGKEINQKRPDGTTVTTTYDKLSRPLVVKSGNTTVASVYDTCQIGRLCNISRDNNYQSAYTYNTDGLVSKEVKTINGISREFNYAYNANGSVFLSNSPLGEMEYYYSHIGSSGGKPTQIYWNGKESARKTSGQYNQPIAQIQYAHNNSSPGAIYNYFATTSPDPTKRIYSMYNYFTYDSGKLAMLSRNYLQLYSPKTAGYANISDENYSYDSVGNIVRIDDAGTVTKKITQYSYDALDRLTRYQVLSPLKGTPSDISYAYSPAGNIQSITPQGGENSFMTYNTDGQGLLLPEIPPALTETPPVSTTSPAPTVPPTSPAPVVCTAPQILDPATNTCKTPTPVCESPQVLDTVTNTCNTPTVSVNIFKKVFSFVFGIKNAYAQTDPITCTLPQVLNAATNTCETPPTEPPTVPTCVSPETLDTATNSCVSPPAPAADAKDTTNPNAATSDATTTPPATSPTAPSSPTTNQLIADLLAKIQSGTFTIKQDGRVYTIIDTSNAELKEIKKNQISGTITLNKGQTTAKVTFKDSFSETPEILIIPKNNTTQPAITATSPSGFSISVSNKDYLNKRTFTYLAFLSDKADAESLPDDIPDTPVSDVYRPQDIIKQEDVLEGTLSNVYTNPQAIIKYQNTYLVYNKLGQLSLIYQYNPPVCTPATADQLPICTPLSLKSTEARTYTGDGRLEKVDNAAYSVSYTYDPSGNKTSETTVDKIKQTKSTTIYWSDTERTYTTACPSTEETACPTDRDELDILVNGKIYATMTAKNGAESYKYYVTNSLGTSSLVIAEDGSIIEETDNDPYGGSRYAVNDLQTASYYGLHEKNDTTGLIDMEARMYDPKTTQFTAEDSTSLYSPTSFLSDPQQLNTYSYARNNPVRYNDPSGNASVKLVISKASIQSALSKISFFFAKSGPSKKTEVVGPAPFIGPAMGGRKNVNPSINFASGINSKVVSKYSISVLQSVARASSNSKPLLVTSTQRTAERQAQIMYTDTISRGREAQYKLYGSYGDQIIDQFPDLDSMINKIYELGPTNISSHIKDPTKVNVLDIDSNSVSSFNEFVSAVKAERRIDQKNFFYPDKDKAFHLEIPQPPY